MAKLVLDAPETGVGLPKKILFCCMLFVGLLAFVEIGARAYQFARNRTFDDALLGTMYRDYYFLGPSFKPGAGGAWQGISDMQINRFGFRGDEFPLEKEPGEVRIVTFGGSTSHSGNYPQKLYDALKRKRKPEHDFRLINAAVPTWNTTQSFIQFTTRALYLQPELIIIYHAINDWNQPDYKWLTDLTEVNYGKFNGILENNLLSYVFLRNKIREGIVMIKATYWDHFDDGNRSVQTKQAPTTDTSIFKTNLENFIAVARSRNIKTVLITMPLNYDPNDTPPEQRMRAGYAYAADDRYVHLVEQTARNNAITRGLEDGVDVFVLDVASTDFGTHAGYFVDLCHFSEEGARRFAAIVEEGLAPILRDL